MTDKLPGAVKALWEIHDEPKLAAMSIDDIRRRAEALHESDHRSRFVGPVIAVVFVLFFTFLLFVGDNTTVQRVGDGIGIAAGLFLTYGVHRLNRDYPIRVVEAMEGIRAYQALLKRLHVANEIGWKTILLVQIAVAVQMTGSALHPGGNNLALIPGAILIGLVVLAALRYRKYGRRIHRRIDELELLGKRTNQV